MRMSGLGCSKRIECSLITFYGLIRSSKIVDLKSVLLGSCLF
jgi:hypothetical protein